LSYTLSKQSLIDKFGFDEDDIVMLFSVFLKSAKDNLDKLDTAIQNNDYDAIYMSAHNLKGSSGNMLLNEAYELSKEIEEASRNKKEIDYQSLFEKMNEIFKNLTLV